MVLSVLPLVAALKGLTVLIYIYIMNAGNDAEISRIKTLISAIGNYGVDKKYLFAVEDLHQAKHIPKVVRCLEEIEKLVTSVKFIPFFVFLFLVTLTKKRKKQLSFSAKMQIFYTENKQTGQLIFSFLVSDQTCCFLVSLSKKQKNDSVPLKPVHRIKYPILNLLKMDFC